MLLCAKGSETIPKLWEQCMMSFRYINITIIFGTFSTHMVIWIQQVQKSWASLSSQVMYNSTHKHTQTPDSIEHAPITVNA